MKKRILFFAALAMAGVLAAQSKYDVYYESSPIDIEHVQPVQFPSLTVSLTSYGAVGDGETLCTEAFAAAIKDLAAQGGGHLIVPRGTWKTGPIVLKSNIDLHLKAGATILFSEDKTLYLDYNKDGSLKEKCVPCVKATKCENVGITGRGVLDGQGFFWRALKEKKVKRGGEDQVWQEALNLGGTTRPDDKTYNIWYPFNLNNGIPNIAASAEEQEKMRYHLINITDSKNVIVQGVTLRNSPKFHFVPTRIQNLIIDGITVDCPWWAQNGDAMDVGNTQVCLIVRSFGNQRPQHRYRGSPGLFHGDLL